jgi:hypothetical protein
MIVNRQLLELMGVCGESLEHFTNVVGRGDANFQMSLDDAVRYLRALEASDPDTYRGWADLVAGFSTRTDYVKAAAQYTYGDYVLIGHAGQTYQTIEAARTAREAKRIELYAQEREKFDGQFYISAVVCCQGGETLRETTAPVEGCEYLVFNPKTGEHERIDSFEAAETRLVEIEHELLDPMSIVRIGRQITVDGAVVAVDVLEDE